MNYRNMKIRESMRLRTKIRRNMRMASAGQQKCPADTILSVGFEIENDFS